MLGDAKTANFIKCDFRLVLVDLESCRLLRDGDVVDYPATFNILGVKSLSLYDIDLIHSLFRPFMQAMTWLSRWAALARSTSSKFSLILSPKINGTLARWMSSRESCGELMKAAVQMEAGDENVERTSLSWRQGPMPLLLSALVKTYIWRSRTFFETRKRQVFLALFLFAPVASVPEIPLFPFLATADGSLCWYERFVAAVVVAMGWSLWMESQERFFLSARDARAMLIGAGYAAQTTGSSLCFLVKIWPACPLGMVLVMFDNGGQALAWFVLIVAAHPFWSRYSGVAVQSILRACRLPTTRIGILVGQAIMDVFPGVRPANTVRYLASIIAMVVAMLVANVPEQEQWAPEFLAVGIALAALPLQKHRPVGPGAYDPGRSHPRPIPWGTHLCVLRFGVVAWILVSSCLAMGALFDIGGHGGPYTRSARAGRGFYASV